MSATDLASIPTDFYFRFALRAPRVDGIPLQAGSGSTSNAKPTSKTASMDAPLLALPPKATLPFPGALREPTPWAEVRAAWNDNGLGFSIEVSGRKGALAYETLDPEKADSVHLWIDTRDTRDIHRASRYCHGFKVGVYSTPSGLVKSIPLQEPIRRASQNAPIADRELIATRAARTSDGYRLEIFFPAEALHGFDPDENRRLGFFYRVTHPKRGSLYLALDKTFPVAEDPSLWCTLELIDAP